MKRLLAMLLILFSGQASAAPLTNAQTYAAQHNDAFRNGTPGMIMVKGTTDNNSYMLEADPTTGAIPVSATVSLGYDTNYGTVGSNTLRTAAEIGVGTSAASETNPVPEKQVGHSYVTSARNAYSSVNVNTTNWVQLVASTGGAVNCLTIFDSGGQTMELGTGAAASETRVLIIPPGGISGCVPLRIAASTRVAIRAISATATVGELDISMLQ